MKRRQFLSSLGTAAAFTATRGIPLTLSGISATHAAEDYKALVCIFLYGGMDNHDTVVPYDTSSYNSWASLRASLVQQYNGRRERSNLLALSPDNASSFDNREFALPPELPGVHKLFQDGNAAIMSNVGPLIEPTNRSSFESGSVKLPPRLFSHNDQQAVWMSSSPEGAQFGWGGFFADAILGQNSSPEFTGITTGGSELFLTGNTAFPYQVGLEGAARVGLEEFFADTDIGPLISAHLRAEQFTGNSLLDRDMTAAMKKASDSNAKYNASLDAAPAIGLDFPRNGFLSAQLAAVAQAISIRSSLGVNRQIFVVAMGGFDTHDAQATSLPGLHTQLDQGITSFYNAMTQLGLSDSVTLFTASDFGRTLAVNGDGTDHGWGAHQFVVGGAVQGRQIVGAMPPSELNHEQDSGGGRLIPSQPVEFMAGPLGSWLGVDAAGINTALPNLMNFGDVPPMLLA